MKCGRIRAADAAAQSPYLMGHLFLAIFLIVFGLNIIFGLALPVWISGALAVIAGVLLLMERFRVHVDRRP